MRILYYFNYLKTPMFEWQKYHFFDEMANYNCFFDVVSPSDYETREEALIELVNKAKSNTYTLFMTCLGDEYIDKKTIQEIKKLNIKTLLFCPDNLKVPFNHKRICKHFDLVWLTAIETEYLFKKWGAKTIFLPYAANPNFLKQSKEVYNAVGFIGTPYGSRVNLINKLLENKIPVVVHANVKEANEAFFRASLPSYLKSIFYQLRFGIGRKLFLSALKNRMSKKSKLLFNSEFLTIKPAVDLEHLGEINSSYALTLSFGEAGHTGVLKKPVDVVNLRNFEVPMSGGIEFTRYTKELSKYYEEDKEIVFFRNEKEMISKARYYLSESSKVTREKIRKNAREKSVKEHSWLSRFSEIFKALAIELED